MTTKTPNSERRYLTTWHYNAALILEELENIVKNHGGKLCETWQYEKPPEWLTTRKTYLITNRGLTKEIRETEERIERLKKIGNTNMQKEYEQKLEGYKQIDNEPVLVHRADYLYIHFTLDGYFYSYSMDCNPFFEFRYSKMKITDNNQINQNYYSNEDKKEWLYDCFWRFDCSAADRREAANLIFNMLLAANTNRTYSDKNRRTHTRLIFLEGSNND